MEELTQSKEHVNLFCVYFVQKWCSLMLINLELLHLQQNEITREDFVRGARVIVGDQVLVQTIRQMHMKAGSPSIL